MSQKVLFYVTIILFVGTVLLAGYFDALCIH